MRRTTVCGLILATCALLSTRGYAVEVNDVTSVDLDKDNTVRTGGSINTAYRILMAGGASNELWLNMDCYTQAKTLLYMNLKTPAGKDLRVYGSHSIGRYIPGVPFEPDADSMMSTDPALNICQQKIPQDHWAGLSAPDKNGDQLFIDLSNSQRRGNMLSLRLGTDYAQIHRDEKYLAPYDFKIHQIQVNCSNHQARIERTFSLNGTAVTDNSTTPDATPSPLPAPFVSPITRLCGLKDISQFVGLGPRVERYKTAADAPLILPDFAQNDPSAFARYPLPDSVNKTIHQVLNSADSTPTFSRLTFTQLWPGPDDSSAQTRIDRLPDGSTLTLDTLILKGVTFYTQYHRLFNIVNLKEWDSMQNSPFIGQSLETDFHAAPEIGKQYHWHTVLKNEQGAEKRKSKSQICLVENGWHDASMLNEKFPGRYLELSCTDDRGDGRAMSSDYAWFEDLRIFIRIGYQEEGKKKRFMFKDVNITR
ncbi:hypothetical protein [Kluyvera genomosp. 1]|uniref:hypothetical protein n=1 Tax=Kluyvera genomosp. 1 TaxID=2774053 RepID=UPI00068B9BBD|nr:hypothetical protein [Kluyvera genomosp. 1]